MLIFKLQAMFNIFPHSIPYLSDNSFNNKKQFQKLFVVIQCWSNINTYLSSLKLS